MNIAGLETSLLPLRSHSSAATSVLLFCRLGLFVTTALDIASFSAVELTRATDNPVKTDVTPLLIRSLLLSLTSIAAWMAALAWREGPGKRGQRLLRSTLSLLSLAAVIHGCCVALTSTSPVTSFLPTLTFSLHAAFVCLPPPSTPSSAQSPPSWSLPLPSSYIPLGCSWLSCYMLVLDHDDKWQVWPLAALVALHTSHAAMAVRRAVTTPGKWTAD